MHRRGPRTLVRGPRPPPPPANKPAPCPPQTRGGHAALQVVNQSVMASDDPFLFWVSRPSVFMGTSLDLRHYAVARTASSQAVTAFLRHRSGHGAAESACCQPARRSAVSMSRKE